MQASEKTQNSRRRAQVTLKLHHNSEGSRISWFNWIKFRTRCNSTCTASSLGSYPTPRYKIRIQYWRTEAGLPHLCVGDFTTLLRYTVDSTPDETPSPSSYHERSSRTWAALNGSLQTPPKEPPKDPPGRTPPQRTGCACRLQRLTSRWALHLGNCASVHCTSIHSPFSTKWSPTLQGYLWSHDYKTPHFFRLHLPPGFPSVSDSFIGLTFLRFLSPALWHHHLPSPPFVTSLSQGQDLPLLPALSWEGPSQEIWRLEAFLQGRRKAKPRAHILREQNRHGTRE